MSLWRHARVRIPLTGAILALALFAITASFAAHALKKEAFARVDEELEVLSEALSSDIEARGLADLAADALREGLEANTLAFRLAHHSAILFRPNEVIARTGDLTSPIKPEHLAAFAQSGGEPFTRTEPFTGQNRLCRFQAVALGGSASGTTLLVFRDLGPILRMLHAANWALAGFTVVGGLVVFAALWVATRRSLNPMLAMITTARSITAENLSQRIAADPRTEELRQLAEVMNSLLDRLEHAFQGQRQLFANAAHELKTPLAVIAGTAQELLAQDRGSASATTALHQVWHTAKGLAAAVDKLLLLAAAETSSPLARQKVSLLDVVEQAILDLAPLASSRGVSVRYDAVEDATILAERPGLLAIVKNLVENAVYFSHPGGEVEVAATCGQGVLTLEVADRGVGLNAPEGASLFEPFVRAAGASAHHPTGSGLGLAIVAGICRRLGGSVQLENRTGGGALARVVLPLQQNCGPEARSFPA